MKKAKTNCAAVFRLAGAFIAAMIGSGFATGQEILQFFSSYGMTSYAVLALCAAGFLLTAVVLLTTGFVHREQENFDSFTHYCGGFFGRIYRWMMPVVLGLIVSVLVAGAGAATQEYFGLNRYLGSAILSLLMLCAYLVGFERLTRILSSIGPIVIGFLLLIGVITILRDGGQFSAASAHFAEIADKQSAFCWPVSGLLYISLNIMSAVPYYVRLGVSAPSKKSAFWGAILGAAALAATIFITNTSILLHAGDTAALSIPTLSLARMISPVFGTLFCVVLLLGIFSSCSTLLWTVCDHFAKISKRREKTIAFSVTVVTYVIGLIPFGKLMSVLYPIIGYVGLPCIFCILAYPLVVYLRKKNGKMQKKN